MPECNRCGKPIDFVENWLGRWVVLERYPQKDHKQTYVEVKREQFVLVHRHECGKSETKK